MHATRETIRDLIPGMYGELRSIAHRYFRQQRAGFTLQPTELVDEACLQLISQPGFECNDPAHFLIEVHTEEGKRSGLTRDSLVSCLNVSM